MLRITSIAAESQIRKYRMRTIECLWAKDRYSEYCVKRFSTLLPIAIRPKIKFDIFFLTKQTVLEAIAGAKYVYVINYRNRLINKKRRVLAPCRCIIAYIFIFQIYFQEIKCPFNIAITFEFEFAHIWAKIIFLSHGLPINISRITRLGNIA